jgi:hypothetical protein
MIPEKEIFTMFRAILAPKFLGYGNGRSLGMLVIIICKATIV